MLRYLEKIGSSGDTFDELVMGVPYYFSLTKEKLVALIIIIFSILIPFIAYTQNTQIKIGVLALRGAEESLSRWEETANYLNNQIPEYSFEIVPLNFEEIVIAVKNNDVDFVLTNSAIYIELEYLYGISRIATLKNCCHMRIYNQFGGVIFTKNNRSDINHLGDLKNKSFMAVHKTSFGGWRMALGEFKKGNINPYKDFSNLQFGGTHDSVVYAVQEGKVDVGTIRTGILEKMDEEGKINIDDFKIINQQKSQDFLLLVSTQLYPEWPFAKVKNTCNDLAQLVSIALLQMPSNSPAAISAKITGWGIPLNYQQVHNLFKELKIGPYEDLGKITLANLYKQYGHWIFVWLLVFVGMVAVTIYVLRQNRKLESIRFALKKSRNSLIYKVKERTQELAEAKNDAENANKMKSQFLANISHELRTPLNIINGNNELLRIKNINKDNTKYITNISNSTVQLTGLINNILDFSIAEKDLFKLELIDFQPSDLFSDICSRYKNLIEKKGLKLICKNDEAIPKILLGDTKRLLQAITLLIDNSVKFTDSGFVSITSSLVSENNGFFKIRFSVEDSGIGISKEDQATLFKSFTQVDGSSTRKYGGVGLGLSLCNKIIKLMGGKVSVKSEIGKGSLFCFEIDLAKSNLKEVISTTIHEPSLEEIVIQKPSPKLILTTEESIKKYCELKLLLEVSDSESIVKIGEFGEINSWKNEHENMVINIKNYDFEAALEILNKILAGISENK